MSGELTKHVAARQQLATAVQLLFEDGDLVSVYSLAANAWEIIDFLASRAGVDSLSNQTRENISSGKDLKFDYVNFPYRNFFKHADRDPDAVLSPLKEKDVEAIVFLAVEDYIRLFRKSPVEFQVFQLWYLSRNVEKLSSESMARVMTDISAYFPNIRSLSRTEQLVMARKGLADAYADSELLGDPRTEAVT